MIIQMILRKVCEQCHVKFDPVDAELLECVAGNLHHHNVHPCIRHLAQQSE